MSTPRESSSGAGSLRICAATCGTWLSLIHRSISACMASSVCCGVMPGKDLTASSGSARDFLENMDRWSGFCASSSCSSKDQFAADSSSSIPRVGAREDEARPRAERSA